MAKTNTAHFFKFFQFWEAIVKKKGGKLSFFISNSGLVLHYFSKSDVIRYFQRKILEY